MPVAGNKIVFTKANVDKAPDKPGVYALYDGGSVICSV